MFYISVLVAGVVTFIIGSLWYGPFFGTAWVHEKFGGSMSKPSNKEMTAIMAATFLLMTIIALGIGKLIPLLDFWTTVMGTILLWFFFVLPVQIVQGLYGKASAKLLLIDCGYWLAVFVASGVVLYLMNA